MNKYIPDLTGVRAIAAYMIFLNHYAVNKIFLEFHTGVTIFFVLSGFLITYLYYPTASLSLNWIKTFYVKRFARIYPVLFLVTVVTFFILNDWNPLHWLLSLTLLKGWFAQYIFIDVSQAWTLTVEAVFYLLAPFVFVLSKKGISLWWQFLALFLIGVFIACRGNLMELSDPAAFITGNLFWFRYTFFGHAFAFLSGILLAKFMLSDKIKFQNGFHKLTTYGGLMAIIGLIWILVSLQSSTYTLGALSPLGVVINNLALPVAIAIFFYGLITEKTFFSWILSTRLFSILGKSSYAFYLIHIDAIPQLLPDIARINIWTYFISLNIMAILIYLLFERPINKFIRRTLT